MFDEPKKLLVVYKDKDEIALNQLKKMVDTNDDSVEGTIVGTEDGTVKIVAWNEKTWIDNKKAGNVGDLDDKILFLGNIKGVDKLIPTLDIKFDKYGVKYGFSGKQAVIIINSSGVSKKEDYVAFVEELKTVCDAKVNDRWFKGGEKPKVEGKKVAPIGVALAVQAIAGGIIGVGVGAITAVTTIAFGDAKVTRQQQLLYGVANLYLNDLDSFMKQ